MITRRGTMLATVLRGAMDLQTERFSMPRPSKNDVIVRVKAVGVCPSGLKLLNDPSRMPKAFWQIPGVPGHEIAAEIVEVGSEVRTFAVGDRVAPTGGPTCGHCHYCRRGLFRFCEAQDFESLKYMGFAEYMACDAKALLRIPDTLSNEEASLAEPLACCVASVEKCSIHPGDSVVIVGAGTMGLLHIQTLRSKGARPFVVEVDERRRAFSRGFGAAEILSPGDEAIERLRELTNGRMASAVFVCVGSARAIEASLDLVGKGGTLVLFAGTWPSSTIALDPNLIHYRQINATGSVGGLMVDFERALGLMAAGLVDVKPLITSRYPLSEVMEAHRAFESGKEYKVLVIP